MYPIDSIKVSLAPSHARCLASDADALLQTRMQIINPTPSSVYSGMIQGTYRIARGEGVLSLWRGMSSVVVGAGKRGARSSAEERLQLTWPSRPGPCRLLCHIRGREALDGGEQGWSLPPARCRSVSQCNL